MRLLRLQLFLHHSDLRHPPTALHDPCRSAWNTQGRCSFRWAVSHSSPPLFRLSWESPRCDVARHGPCTCSGPLRLEVQSSSGPLTTKHFPNIFGSEICRLDKWLPELGISSAASSVNFRVDNKEEMKHQTKMSYISTGRNPSSIKVRFLQMIWITNYGLHSTGGTKWKPSTACRGIGGRRNKKKEERLYRLFHERWKSHVDGLTNDSPPHNEPLSRDSAGLLGASVRQASLPVFLLGARGKQWPWQGLRPLWWWFLVQSTKAAVVTVPMKTPGLPFPSVAWFGFVTTCRWR